MSIDCMKLTWFLFQEIDLWTHEEKRTMLSTLSHFVQDQRRKPTEKTFFNRSFTRNACYLLPEKSWDLETDFCDSTFDPKLKQLVSLSFCFTCLSLPGDRNAAKPHNEMMCFYCCLPHFHTYFQSAKKNLTWNRSQWPMLCITTIFMSNFLTST